MVLSGASVSSVLVRVVGIFLLENESVVVLKVLLSNFSHKTQDRFWFPSFSKVCHMTRMY